MTSRETLRIAGVEVPRIGFAGLHLAGPGGWGEPGDRQAASALLRAAYDEGVRLVDTADTLGPGVSEEIIRETLHPYPDDVVIATKAGMTRSGAQRWGVLGRPDYLAQQVHVSLHRLRLETIPLFTLHRVDPAYPLADQLGALAELRDAGAIAHIGLSAVSPEQLDEALTIAPIAAVQSHYNLVSRRNDAVLDRTAALGIPFVAYWGLGHGRTLIDAPAVQTVAARLGATAAQVLIAWLLQRSPNIIALPGTGSAARLRSNYAALGLELDAEALAALEQYARTARPVPDLPPTDTTP